MRDSKLIGYRRFPEIDNNKLSCKGLRQYSERINILKGIIHVVSRGKVFISTKFKMIQRDFIENLKKENKVFS